LLASAVPTRANQEREKESLLGVSSFSSTRSLKSVFVVTAIY
jgi:hypothetical protein